MDIEQFIIFLTTVGDMTLLHPSIVIDENTSLGDDVQAIVSNSSYTHRFPLTYIRHTSIGTENMLLLLETRNAVTTLAYGFGPRPLGLRTSLTILPPV